MAMVTPVGVSLDAFDAQEPQVFSFNVSGGNQVVMNKITIVDYDDITSVVYENVLYTYAFNQTVPASTMTNGNRYKFSFVTYDVYGNASDPSDYVDFWCFTTPVIAFTNVSEGMTVNASNYSFEATYSQEEGEKLDGLRFVLYDDGNNIVSTSSVYTSTDVPPVSFSHLFSGFENDTTYKIGIIGSTIYGTDIRTRVYSFSVRYSYPEHFQNVEAVNLCDDGYNQIRSNLRVLRGFANFNLQYIDNEKANVLDIERTNEVYWRDDNEGIVTADFVMQLWFQVGLTGKLFRISNTENNVYFEGSLIREVPYGKTKTKDCVQVLGYVDGIKVFDMKSNYIDLTNNTADLILYFKYNPTNSKYKLVLNEYNKVDNYITMGVAETITGNLATLNDENIITYDSDEIVIDTVEYIVDPQTNVEYNRLTNIRWQNLDTTYVPAEQVHNEYGDMTSGYPFNLVELFNGVYDGLYITTDISMDYTLTMPDWDYYTCMRALFQNNLEAGNVTFDTSSIEYFRLKSRVKGTFDWITLYNIYYNGGQGRQSTRFTINDYIAPSGVTMEYAFIPVYYGGIESSYNITEIDTIWSRLFVTDTNGDTLSLVGNVQLGNLTSNGGFGTLQPIARKYPIVVNNSQIDYDSGTISGTILSDKISESLTHENRREIVEKREAWDKMLKNGKAKIIKDWNGFIWLARVASNPTYSTSQTMGNGYGNISFTFVEQGKWNSSQDLYENGFIASA